MSIWCGKKNNSILIFFSLCLNHFKLFDIEVPLWAQPQISSATLTELYPVFPNFQTSATSKMSIILNLSSKPHIQLLIVVHLNISNKTTSCNFPGTLSGKLISVDEFPFLRPTAHVKQVHVCSDFLVKQIDLHKNGKAGNPGQTHTYCCFSFVCSSAIWWWQRKEISRPLLAPEWVIKVASWSWALWSSVWHAGSDAAVCYLDPYIYTCCQEEAGSTAVASSMGWITISCREQPSKPI